MNTGALFIWDKNVCYIHKVNKVEKPIYEKKKIGFMKYEEVEVDTEKILTSIEILDLNDPYKICKTIHISKYDGTENKIIRSGFEFTNNFIHFAKVFGVKDFSRNFYIENGFTYLTEEYR